MLARNIGTSESSSKKVATIPWIFACQQTRRREEPYNLVSFLHKCALEPTDLNDPCSPSVGLPGLTSLQLCGSALTDMSVVPLVRLLATGAALAHAPAAILTYSMGSRVCYLCSRKKNGTQ